MPTRALVEIPARRSGKTMRMQAMAGDVDYRELLVKYMRHVAAEEGSTFVARIGNNRTGYSSGVTFSASEVLALLVCNGEAL